MVQKRRKNQSTPSKSKFSMQLTRKGVGFLGCLIVLISAWTFILGVFVGRDTAPLKFDIKKLENRLAALKAIDIQKKLKRFKISAKDSKEEKPQLEFHEALKTRKSEIHLPTVLPAPLLDKLKAAPAPKKKEVEKKPEQPKAKKTSSKPIAPVKKTDPQKTAPSDKKKKLAVQVASIKHQKDAERMVARLKAKGYPAYKTIGKVPGKGLWFRIKVGPYEGKQAANQVLSRLKKENLKGFILNYN